MARLHQYGSNSSKNGYHLKGWTKHSGNTTLQVRYPCELLFDWMDLEPGDRIPSDLITSLLGANLLYTIGDGTAIDEEPEWTPSLDTISEDLTDGQRERLLGFIREYDGPRYKFIKQLQSEVDTGEGISGDARLSSHTSDQQNWYACIDSTSRGADESLHQIANQVFDSRPLTEEARSIIQKWNTDSSLEKLAEAPHIESSVRLFHNYVGTVNSLWVEDDALVYLVSLPDTDRKDSEARFFVNHFPKDVLDDGTERFESVFKIIVPDDNTERLPVVNENETVLHQIIIADGEALYWSVGLLEGSFRSNEIEKAEFGTYLEVIFDVTSQLVESLIGETIGESSDDIEIEFDTESPK
ncbi:hypothetical protein SAMN05216277_103248 [Halolamina pelagica]|uniref:Uncharacterized protein n=2 Tax=Haloferacaceae TaxID=1644056 RepID=A0A1I5Q3W2_9EURY|nr:hypothetical protein SAMN05216277_103248 [Halolamina pelagica]